ncbi:MAG: exo-alpha-sialidase [Victivallales bacterium]|nr:exo-alpha-sialidase [Victivallales bacterium]
MLKISLEKISTGFTENSNYCYVHARAGLFPDGRMLMTTQKLRLSGSDIFSGLEMLSRKTPKDDWSPITLCPGLSRRPFREGTELAMCDATPFYHKASGKMILTGHSVCYKEDEMAGPNYGRSTLWSIFDEASQSWLPYRRLEMPEEFQNCGAGCTQILEKKDGTLLVPASLATQNGTPVLKSDYYGTVVMRCAFDGKELRLLELGNILYRTEGRGLCEPSIVHFKGKYYMCMRNDLTSYIAVSDDGLNFTPPQEWLFDDGSPLGSYNTQQHWIFGKERLYLVYTRKAEFNNHIFRHRAPLFIAEVDCDKLRVIRATEQVAVPMRGARLGNFGCLQLDTDCAYVTAAEWMQTTPPDCCNFRRCMSYGSDNTIFLAKIEGL